MYIIHILIYKNNRCRRNIIFLVDKINDRVEKYRLKCMCLATDLDAIHEHKSISHSRWEYKLIDTYGCVSMGCSVYQVLAVASSCQNAP